MSTIRSAALDIPFRIDGTGRIQTTHSLQREIAVRLESLIGTTPGERVMRPAYGAGAAMQIMDSNDELGATRLVGRITDTINALEPAVIVEDVRVLQMEPMGGLLRIGVSYRLAATGEIETSVISVSPTSSYGWPA